MRLLSTAIFRWRDAPPEHPVMLTSAFCIGSFGYFQRGPITEMCVYLQRMCAQKTPAGGAQKIEHEGQFCYVLSRPSGLSGTLIADSEYPQRVAFVVLKRFLDGFEKKFEGRISMDAKDNCQPFPELDAGLAKYQDPRAADKLAQVQGQVDEVTDIMQKNIDQMLERGEKLDDLVDRSDLLSVQAKQLYKVTKKHNSKCCK